MKTDWGGTPRAGPEVPELAADHARRHRDVVISRLVVNLGADRPDWIDASYPSAVAVGAVADREAELDRFEATVHHAVNLPLGRLNRRDAELLCAIGLIEDDVRFGALFASRQDPLPSRRPCVGLLAWLLANGTKRTADVQERAQALATRGLLTVDNIGDPRSEWVPRVPVAVWDLLHRGRIQPASLPPTLTLRTDFPALGDVMVSGELADAAKRLPDLVRGGAISAIVLRGMDGSGRLTLLGAVAAELGQATLVHAGTVGDQGWSLLAALAELGDAFPVVVADPGPGQTLMLPALTGLDRPLGVVLGRSGGLGGPPTERAVGYALTPATAAQRRSLWAAAAPASTEDADAIVKSFLLTPGNINRAAHLAIASATADGRELITPADVRTSTRALQRQTLETLATRLEPLPVEHPPVLGAAATDELGTLLARCRQRENLAAADGALRGMVNRGVRALFGGPSGTGKTLTARYLGAQLHLDVYRVDLAAVVNKYVGETERNLDQVLARAEELDVLLLLDEGDALMTRRTEVSNANDRYANLQTNFLLQRLETFDGIAVITTNAGNRIDPAFLRRIDVTIDFAPPDAGQRRQLWRAHLPAHHDVPAPLLDQIARRCVFTGGQIRNAALHARLLGLERSDRISADDVLRSVQREYRRVGASSPLGALVAAGPEDG